MKDLIEYDLPVQERQIDVVHILNNGEVIMSVKELEPFQDKFKWVNPSEVQHHIISLRQQTDSNRKSIIAIFETREIKTYSNVSKNFTNYNLLNKSGL